MTQNDVSPATPAGVDSEPPTGTESGGGYEPPVAKVAAPAVAPAEDPLVEEGEIAGDYLEQLLDTLDFDGDIDLDVDGERAMVSIDGGSDLQKLVGSQGEVLDALQELTRLAVQQVTGERSRLMLDVAGWRASRRSKLSRLGAEVASRVLATGLPEELQPMTPFERKIVHDAVAAVSGVVSQSDGAEPNRRVVVLPTPVSRPGG